VNKAVFLDRDGVLNRGVIRSGRPFAPLGLEDLDILPGVPDALEALRAAGFLLIVVTNQPDVARGLAKREQVDAIHAFMRDRLSIDEIRVCYHDDADHCVCRKPSPGMIYAAAVERAVQLDRSFMVGDRWRDVGAAKRAGCTAILVNALPEETRIEPDIELSDLPAAAAWILSRSEPDWT